MQSYLLYREISKYSLADIRMSLAQISTGSIVLSVLLAIINYIILIGYDWLALKGIHKTLPVSRVSLVSFVGQAVSYNFGALLGAVRCASVSIQAGAFPRWTSSGWC